MTNSPRRLHTCLLLCFGCLVPSYLSDDTSDDSNATADPASSSSGTRKIPEVTWGENDPVEIYYAEFLLSRWVLDHAPWNAYHSGLAFSNNRTGEKILFDYCPENVSSVMRMLVPQVTQKSLWRTLLFGDIDVGWKNGASVKFFSHWPKSYTNMVLVGKTNGDMANRFARWVRDKFGPTHTTFDPLEILLNNGSNLRSTMCHDFVTDSLWVLYRKGVKLRPREQIFRDHIIMYAESVEKIYPADETVRHRREFLRYLRLLRVFYTKIADQFTYGRDALIINWKLGLPTYMRTKGVDHRVQLSPPFLNYCYLPLAIPPQKHNLLGGQKLCALAMEANITNTSVPVRDVAALSSEGRLDRDEALTSITLIALVAALFVRSPAKA